jgi:hypothetical protein
MHEQPVFEAVFLERYRHGLQELVPKTAVPGDEGEIPISVPGGWPSQLPLSLYHGFRPDDPFVTLDCELAIRFEQPPREGDTIYLGWRVLEDRTISYWWRMEGGPPQSLHDRSTHGHEVAQKEQNLQHQNRILQKLTVQ